MARKSRHRIQLVALGDTQALSDAVTLGDNLTLRELMELHPALSVEPISAELLDLNIHGDLVIEVKVEPWARPLYRIPGLTMRTPAIAPANGRDAPDSRVERKTGEPGIETEPASRVDAAECLSDAACDPALSMPEVISEKTAAKLAYSRQIESVASFLRGGLSVLVFCDKLVVEHLWEDMVIRAGLEPELLMVPDDDEKGFMPRGLRQRQLARLKEMITRLKRGRVLVIPHLDLLAGGDSSLPTESRELIELVYEASDRLILAFADRSLELPEVLSSRFAARVMISGMERTVAYPNGEERPIGAALVTSSEAAQFTGFDPEGVYKNVAGMNPVRFRHAIQYAVKEFAGQGVTPVSRLYSAIRAFKAQTSANFEVPDVKFSDIGGYREVKEELLRSIELMTGSVRLPNDQLRKELIPRGFIFHGPPGTGKTLFAKAVANQLNATIQVVSGPEVTDMYVGESERKVRELFAEARRNAPAVIVFDEFDSIATRRSGREDGGSRAGNALVAQMLTEMDGFRPDVPMLVIGTTNRLDIIDDALLRPSRFRAIAIGLPNPDARRAIARVHASHFGIDISQELLEVIAAGTEGLNGDDIRSLFRDACVGMHCMTPAREPDARMFGGLVGKIRQSKQQHEAAIAEHGAQRPSARTGGRPAPAGTMVPLTPIDTVPTPSGGEDAQVA